VAASLIKELLSLPGAEEVLWEVTEGLPLHELAFQLRYSLERYLPLVNGFLSLNDPTSYLHVRTFYHLARDLFCLEPTPLSAQKYAARLQANSAEARLYRRGSTLITSNFLAFQPEGPPASLDEAASNGPEVWLWVSPSAQSGGLRKFVHNKSLYYLPLSMFTVTRVERLGCRVEVQLAENLDQPIVSATAERRCSGE
jgi:hypothetical protein